MASSFASFSDFHFSTDIFILLFVLILLFRAIAISIRPLAISIRPLAIVVTVVTPGWTNEGTNISRQETAYELHTSPTSASSSSTFIALDKAPHVLWEIVIYEVLLLGTVKSTFLTLYQSKSGLYNSRLDVTTTSTWRIIG